MAAGLALSDATGSLPGTRPGRPVDTRGTRDLASAPMGTTTGLRVVLGGGAFVLALGVRPARANFEGQDMTPIGEAAALMGGSAAAWVDDGSSTWYNPAGLGAVRRAGLSANLSAYGMQILEVPGFFEIPSLDVSGDLESSVIAIVPSYISYVKPIGGDDSFRHALGLAIVVPDSVKAEAVLEIPAGDYAFNLFARVRHEQRTMWIAPGWGACLRAGAVCFGASALVALRTSATTSVTTVGIVDEAGDVVESGETRQGDTSSWSLGGQVGVQLRLTPALRIGLSLRSPIVSITGGGSLLVVDSSFDSTGQSDSYVRRVEDRELTVEYHLPPSARLGVALDAGRVDLTADVVASLAQASFANVRGEHGEREIQPVDASGADVGEPIEIGEDLERGAIVDVALGVGAAITETTHLRAGGFTNFSGAASGADDLFGTRFGATLGLSMRAEKSATHIGLSGALGSGTTQGIRVRDDAVEAPAIDTRFYQFFITLGGSADL